MVSRYKRHLSLFLVIVLVMSWFVVSSDAVRAQAVDPNFRGPPEPVVGPPAAPATYDRNFNPGTAPIATVDKGFTVKTVGSKEYVIHRYFIPSLTETIHEQWFELASDLLIVPGCKSETDGVGKIVFGCDKTKPTTFNYFQSTPLKTPIIVKPQNTAVGFSVVTTPGTVTETYQATGTLKVYRFVGAGGTADQKAPVLVRYTDASNDFTYGVLGVDVVKFDSSNGHPKSNGSLTGLIYNRLDGKRNPMATTFGNNYIRYFNCLSPYTNCERQRSLLGSGTSAGSTTDMFALFKAWFSPDTIGEEATRLAKLDATITLEDSVPVETPPFIKIVPTAESRLPGVFVFKLTDVLTTNPIGDDNTRNNYFLFQMTAESFATLKSTNALTPEIAALIDPSKAYATLDLAGNLGIVISERKIGDKTYSIFNQDKRILDENVATGIQGFDGDKISSKSQQSGMYIKPDTYKKVITKRVYNEQYLDDSDPPAPTQRDGNTCNVLEPVNYPETNTSYDRYAGGGYMEASGLPNKPHASCLNKAEGSWLAKWGAKVDRIDKATSGTDACAESFKGSFIVAQFLAKPMCAMLYMVVGAATWFAGFSVDFLIEAVGLQ